MKATLHSYSLDINYQCPNCRLFFRLSNSDIPTGNDKKSIRCAGCGEQLKVEPLKIVLIPHKNISNVIDSIINLGWSKDEAEQMISKALSVCPTNEESDLLKIALSLSG